jgi:hypothetical protein
MFKFVLERTLERKIDRAKTGEQVERLVDLGMRSNRGKGWTHSIRWLSTTPNNNEYVYRYEVSLDKVSGHQGSDLLKKQANAIKDRISQAGVSSQFGKRPWGIPGFETVKKVRASDLQKSYGTAKIPDKDLTFPGIFGREPHIHRITSAVRLALETKLQKRHHCILHGPPGCGKSEILERFGQQLGPEGQAYLSIDAPSTTQAGITQKLMEAPNIPPILMIEEIEKTQESALTWLLGIMDQRGKITRLNFRTGYQFRNIRVLVLATANNIELFRRVMSGALESRFSHKVYCSRPDEEVMAKILEREIRDVNGDTRWIAPTIEFCMGELDITDPREIVPICLCGQDKLLDGSYQEIVRKTRKV